MLWAEAVPNLLIALREGLEAMLVIAALAGYLVKVGSGNRVNALYLGAFAAVIASVIGVVVWTIAKQLGYNPPLCPPITTQAPDRELPPAAKVQ